MSSSRAIYIDAEGEFSVRDITETYTPTGAQSLISVKYSAINPADLRHFYDGYHSSVAGYEYIGPVLSTGPESPFKKGDILFGIAQIIRRRPLHYGVHQDYMIVEPFMAEKLPPNLVTKEEQWPQVVGWPVGMRTAIDALFNCMGFGLPALNAEQGEGGKDTDVDWVVEGTDPGGKALLIWGASSTVGAATLQIARTAGFSPIFVTASSHNHPTLLELGATACFDYRSPSVVSDIQAAVRASGKPLANIFDAVTVGTGFAEPPSLVPLDLTKSSPALAKQCLTPGLKKEDVRVCASLVVEFDSDWIFCLSVRTREDTPVWYDRLEKMLKWVLAHAEDIGYRVPKVRIVEGAEEGIRMIKEVFAGKASMEKVVIKHPM